MQAHKPPLLKNQVIPLTIDGMTAEGNGVGHYEGMAVFVPRTAVGDVLDVKIVKVNKQLAYGIVQTIHTPSADRIEPDCPVFSQCGGCLFRHISYEAECSIKTKFVEDAFIRIGGLHPKMLPILGADAVDGYRNKAQLPCGKETDNSGICFGFYAQRSHRIIPHHSCRLQPESFSPVIARCKELLAHIAPYDEVSNTGILRHLYLRQGHHSGEMMVCFVVTKSIRKQLTTVARQLMEEFPQIVSVMMNINPKQTNVILGKETICLVGAPVIHDTFCGIPVALSPQSFYQVNTPQAERLFAEVRTMAQPQPHHLLLDLYCGTGVIGLSMADAADKLIGVEVIPQAVENAKQNAARAGIGNAEFFVGDAGQIAQQLAQQHLRPDLITLDPPRKGCDDATLNACISMAPQKIVMVSCNPATAARDAAYLCKNGYHMEAVRPVDLFPRTGHVESVVCLSREKAIAPSQNFRIAQQDDAEHVLSLYQSAKSSAFCVWNDSYPSIAEIEHDLETKNLYVMTDGSKIIGAISVVPENELDSFDCWSCKNGKEIARVVIDRAYQGRGLSFEMVQRIESVLREKGHISIRLSVVKSNIPAYKTYIKAGFAVVGEAQMYGNDYYLMDKVIDTTSLPKRITDECVVLMSKNKV